MTSPAGAAMRLLLVDNRDSFTHILAEQLRRCGATVTVRDHQAALTRAEVETFDAAVLSPGPGRPQRAADVGTCPVVLEADIPVLGVCLGHQLMAHTLGARVDELAPVHGRTAEVTHDATGLFDGLLSPLRCVRYHSLAVLEPVPEALEVTARAEDGTVMACDFPGRPWWGVQFHPESLDAAGGLRLLGNFLRLAAAWNAAHRPRVRTRRLPFRPDPAASFEALFAASPTAVWLDDACGGPSVLADASGPRARTVTADVAAGTVTVDGVSRPGDVFEFLAAATPRGDSVGECPVGPGWIGYLGYELKGQCMPGGSAGSAAVHRAPYPDAALIFADRGVVVTDDAAWLFAYAADADAEDGDGNTENSHETWFDATESRLCATLPAAPATVEATVEATADASAETTAAPAAAPTTATSAATATPPRLRLVERAGRACYLRRIAAIQRAIEQGETYEACLTTALTGTGEVGLGHYLALRAHNPSPFGSYLRFAAADLYPQASTTDGHPAPALNHNNAALQVLSTSPEVFLTVGPDPTHPTDPTDPTHPTRRVARSKPIKGTRPRGRTAAEDVALRADLAASPKDRAENLMIADLVRNDLARTAEPGSVRVPVAFDVETYATVHQLVTTVESTPRADVTAIEVLRAAFPGGSMTGAPKARTLEILDRLEDSARGVYSGAIGHVGVDGTARFAMPIRTLVADGTDLHYGVGGAVLALSDPDSEYEELKAKSAALAPIAEVIFPQ